MALVVAIDADEVADDGVHFLGGGDGFGLGWERGVGQGEAAEGGLAGAEVQAFGLGQGGAFEGLRVGELVEPSKKNLAFLIVQVFELAGRRDGAGSGWEKEKDIL